MKAKAKPKVKFDEFEFKFCGELYKVKKKLTLIGVLKGEEAREVNHASGGFTAHYDGTKGKEMLEFYKEETVENKIIKL